MQALLLVLCCLVLSSTLVSADETWIQEPDGGVVPSTRGGGRLVYAESDNILFYWGGSVECFNASECDHVYRDDLYHYDLYKKKWIKILSPDSSEGVPPAPRVKFGADYWDEEGVVVIFGGIQYNINLSVLNFYNDIWFYYPSTKRWQLITQKNTGPGARAPSVAVYKDELYVFGGLLPNFSISNDLWKFDLRTKRWIQLFPNGAAGSPPPVYSTVFKLEKYSETIILHGGNLNTRGAQTNETYSYDIKRETWTQLATIQRGATYVAAEIYKRTFFVAFGDLMHWGNDTGCRTNAPSAGQSPTDRMLSLNLKTNNWEVLSPLAGPGPLKRLHSARVGNRMYITGGFNFVCPEGPTETGYSVYNPNIYSIKLK